MDPITRTEYEKLEGVRTTPEVELLVEKGVEHVQRSMTTAVLFGSDRVCRSCGYDTDEDGYCAFCGETTLPR